MRSDGAREVMHLSMLSPKGGGGGTPGICGAFDFSEEFFGQNPHRGAPKLGQIRSNIPTFSINLY